MRKHIHAKNKIAADTFVADFDTRNVSTGSSASNQLKLNFATGSQFNTPRTVDWGDGVIDIIPGATAAFTHTYSVEGVYTVKIKANTFSLNFNNTNDRLKILEVKNWGTYTIVNNTFWGCANLVLSNTTGKPLVQSANDVFYECKSITTINGINEWDFSTVTTIIGFLAGCILFNQRLSLNTINVTSFNHLCSGCSLLEDAHILNFSKATDIGKLYENCPQLYKNIHIDAPLATIAQNIFNGTPLNGASDFYLNIPKVTNANRLLINKPNFNPTNFYLNISGATDISYLLLNNSAFNPTNFTLISNSALTATAILEGCTAFNKPLNGIDTSNTTAINGAFSGALAFDQDLSYWNVASVNTMQNAFVNSAFNQSLASWTFNKNVVLQNIMFGKTPANYSAANYDILLQKVATAVVGTGRTQTNKAFGMGTIKYTAAGKPYRDALVADGWTITDGGMI